MAVDRADGYPGHESDGGLLPPISLSNSVVSRASDMTPMSNKRKMMKSESSGTDSDYTSMSSGSPTKLPSLRGKSNSIVSLTSRPRLCRTPSCPNLFEADNYMLSPPPRNRKFKPKAKDDSTTEMKLPSIFDKSPGYIMSQPSRGQSTPRGIPSQQSNRMTPSTIVGESRQWYNQKHERTFYEKQDYSSPTAYTPNPVQTPALLFPIATSKEIEARNRKKAKREKKKRRQTTEVQYHDLGEVKPKQVGDSTFEVKEKKIQKDKQKVLENKENSVRTQLEESANIRGQVHGPILVYADAKKDAVVTVESELSISQSERKCREWLTGLDPPTTAELREKVATTS